MGRRVKPYLFAAGIGLAALLLMTCFNPFDIIAELETEVKIANNKFLIVESITPAKNATGVQPGSSILIEFDRDLDESTINTSTIVFDPPPDPVNGPMESLEFEFDDGTNTLTIDPEPYMDGEVDYTVTVNAGLKGLDGSELQAEFIWTFLTKNWPAGGAAIDITGDLEGDEYINAATDGNQVRLLLFPNSAAEKYRYSTDLVNLEAQSFFTIPSPTVNVASFGTQGQQNIYVQFSNSGENEVSNTETAAIIRDTAAPETVSASDKTINMYTAMPTKVYATASDETSGIGSYAWTASSGAVNFDAANVEDAIIGSVSDGSYTLTLTVYDEAGNGPSADTMALTVDTVAPGIPTVSSATYTTDRTPIWTWTAPSGAVGYRYSLDGARGVSTTSTSYTPGKFDLLSYGDHTLTVQARDAAGNYSSAGSKAIHIHPPIDPSHGEPVSYRTAVLSWGAIPGIHVSYDVYLGTTANNMAKVWSTTGLIFDPSLTPLRTYYWGIVAKEGKVIIYTSPTVLGTPYTFTTTLF